MSSYMAELVEAIGDLIDAKVNLSLAQHKPSHQRQAGMQDLEERVRQCEDRLTQVMNWTLNEHEHKYH